MEETLARLKLRELLRGCVGAVSLNPAAWRYAWENVLNRDDVRLLALDYLKYAVERVQRGLDQRTAGTK